MKSLGTVPLPAAQKPAPRDYFISACAISLALAWSEPAAAQRMKAGLLACDVSTGNLLLWPFIMLHVSRYLPNTL
jgi:hypothetical protein